MGPVRTHTFNGHKYSLVFDDNIGGLCDDPKDKTLQIMVLVRPGTKKSLRILLHECLHAENWSKSEKIIDRVSTEISDLLWKLGYRQRKPKK